MTVPLSGATSSTAVPRAGTSDRGAPPGDGLGQDAFMKLLVAQMKYQNPMAPTDGQAYMTQMATFTQVEKLGQLVSAQSAVAQWQKRLSAEGMVGREIHGTLPAAAGGGSVTGVVTGLRFTAEGAVLELADGRTLGVDAVERVVQRSAT